MWFSFFITWEQRKLGELGKAQSGIGFPDKEQGGKKGIPFFKVSDMNNLGNELEMHIANNYVSLEQIKKNGWSPIEETSVIFAKVGAAIMLNRKRLVRFPFLLDNNTMAYKFNDAWEIDFGRTLFERIDLTSLVQVGALPSYNAGDVENMEVAIPQKAEQTKLGALFTSLDNLITLHQRKQNWQNLRFLRKISSLILAIAWEQRKAYNVADYSKGCGYSKSDLKEFGTPIILYGRLYTKYQFIISEVDTFVVPKSGSYYSQGNEVIIPASGETAEDIARASAVGISGVLLGGDLNILHPYDFINPAFLALAISNGVAQRELAKKAQGKSVVHIHNSDIQEVPIAYPLRIEQEQIVGLFRNLDNLITLHQCKRAAFMSRKSPPIFQFEKWRNTLTWEQRKLGDIVSVCSGKDYKHLNEGDIPVYGTGGYMLSVSEALSYFDDAIGIGRKGTIDKPYILKAPFWTVDTLFYVVPKEKTALDFVYCLFQIIDWKSKDESTGVPSLSKVAINSVDISVPKSEEQVRIGTVFFRIDNLITLHQRGENIYNRRQTW